MSWFRKRRLDAEHAARRLAEAQRKIVDQAARVARLEAEVGVYRPLMKKKGSE